MFAKEEKEKIMKLAFLEADKAEQQGEIPIGAVIVDAEGNLIGRGYNRRELDEDATRHAEIIAIQEACKNLNSWRLIDCSLFVTLEPCPMCAGAIINARLKNVYYGAFDPKAGACGSVVDLFAFTKFNHHPQIFGGLYREQAAQQLKKFFKNIRQQNRI
ncbi:tRNA adenosine(34) deaminase TadA [Lactobacillus iners]|uniref:tRNA adenosine(34) deaminase TadA n=1 Tax=Lactobacillus iners TaxID=147802 RepID=UPI0001E5DE7E|nr:tRNA adenosine(34) deaminase TadA [Lactobacillus iners]EFO67493.1 cytidine and deoxycytidylate deaminase zinc-binding region [Lactobacillus iners LactinV 09V1-c]EFO71617.1 cytidine and deoxycytidylate deaminase zinc-binding region [Lactobacillus iners SPIN 2503V10-D]MCT7685720.1 tRNA adenosine(34) deaminase TadA [Lactobacillus iners]MCT7703886.1 tRNA adenosine(34) deaminase TadA [Lactobacillus iners]MCT7710422.1 tRNA adenosine(34) deaminase TadA [Lactobacillus iners]